MKLFIDSANIKEIEELNEWGILNGVTTNPSLVAKEGKDYDEIVKKICNIVDGPISVEVTRVDDKGMIEQAIELSRIHKNVVIKIPATQDGLRAIKALYKKNIRTNATLIFSANQALLAANAGASYVSPFIGRMDDIGQRGMDVVEQIHEIFTKGNVMTKIIVASIRNPIHVIEAARVGADIATVPYKILRQMIKHPLTDAGQEKFINDYMSTFRTDEWKR